jgi:hypothetical protein
MLAATAAAAAASAEDVIIITTLDLATTFGAQQRALRRIMGSRP